jgi:hypothetical protein
MPDETVETRLARLEERQAWLLAEFAVLRAEVVTSKEFVPVRTVVYGLVGLILMSVGTAFIALVLRNRP